MIENLNWEKVHVHTSSGFFEKEKYKNTIKVLLDEH
jgi:hypothetical protein